MGGEDLLQRGVGAERRIAALSSPAIGIVEGRGWHDRAPGREDGLLLSRSRQDPVAPRIIAEGLVDGNDIGERDALRLGRRNRRRNDAVIRAARKLRLDRVGIDPGL